MENPPWGGIDIFWNHPNRGSSNRGSTVMMMMMMMMIVVVKGVFNFDAPNETFTLVQSAQLSGKLSHLKSKHSRPQNPCLLSRD